MIQTELVEFMYAGMCLYLCAHVRVHMCVCFHVSVTGIKENQSFNLKMYGGDAWE